MTELFKPDLCIVGASHAGVAAALAARAAGASVILVDSEPMGAGQLDRGHLPVMALAAAGRQAQSIRQAAAFGIANDTPKVGFRRVHEHVREVTQALAPAVSAERFAALGGRFMLGEARFADRRTLAIDDALIRARRFILAGRARPLIPPIPGLADVPFFTLETIAANTRKLSHLVVIGASPAAIALAQAYRRLGSDVSLVAPGPFLPHNDPELVAVVWRALRDDGVVIYEHTEVSAIQSRSMGIGITLGPADNDQQLDVSHILVAMAGQPDFDGLGLGKAAIRLKPEGGVQLTPALRTSNRRIYAIGDAAGADGNGHAGAWQAERVVARALYGPTFQALRLRRDFAHVPVLIHTDPELAEVGLTELMAQERHVRGYRIIRAAFAENDRARAWRQSAGLVKLVTAPSGRVLGAGLVGPQAAELVSLFAFMIANRLTIAHLEALVAPYPSLSAITTLLVQAYHEAQPASPWPGRLMAVTRLFP